MADIQTALERLLRAYEAAGGRGPFDPAEKSDLAELRAMVAPLRVPDELEFVWRRFQEQGPPGILDTQSLETVQLAIRAAPHTGLSRALLTIGSGGSRRCYVELHDPDGTGGGSVWTLEEFAPELHEAAPSLAALLEATAVAWERGIARLSEDHPFPWAAWDLESWGRLRADTLPAGRVAGARPAGWLPRWIAAEGLTPIDVLPHGPTTSIADLLIKGKTWAGIETIRGRILSLVSAEAVAATVDDGTGVVHVYVPHEADRFMLLNGTKDFELDVRPFPTRMRVVPPFDAKAFDALATAVRDA